MRLLCGALLLWLTLLVGSAAAHEIRPVFLDIRGVSPNHYAVIWKRPVFGGYPLPVLPRFPADCRVREVGPVRIDASSATARLDLRCPSGLAGRPITLEGLSRTMVDGLVRVEFASGQVASGLARPDAPTYVVPKASGGLDVFRTYSQLGVEHILLGYDHLLFVLALVLFVKTWRRLLTTATAFTLAHSITLSLAALGVIHVPVPPVEAMIALSILFLALELVRAVSAPERAAGLRPAALAFVFGLLHGLGFASALAAIGLPRHEIPLSLFAFNVGVEIGQVLFILALLGIGALVRKSSPALVRRGYWATTYVIGGLAAFWTLERIANL